MWLVIFLFVHNITNIKAEYILADLKLVSLDSNFLMVFPFLFQ